MEEVFVAGCGYVGERVARVWLERGARVRALVRRPERAECLRDLGVVPVHGDLDLASTLTDLPVADALVYYFAPPPGRGTTDPRIKAFLAATDRGAPPIKLVYISTTGVYGDRRGGWVNEDTAVAPRTPRARRRWDAETILRRWEAAHAVPVVILRVPGIYGPDRIPVDRIRQGIPVVREEEAPYSNRIHVDDLVRVCVAAALKGKGGAVYNASDGAPGTMTQYFYAVADAAGLPRPRALTLEEASRALTPQMVSFLGESRRIDNRRMREELGVEPAYPDVHTGLSACLPSGGDAP